MAPRSLIPNGKVDRTGLRRWFRDRYGYQPGWYTLAEAVRQGMPCEAHPLTGKPLFDLIDVENWIAARQSEPIQITFGKPPLTT